MINKNFVEKVNEVYLEFCKDPNCLSLGTFDSNLWLFSHIFNTRPYYGSLDGMDSEFLDYLSDGIDKEDVRNWEGAIKDRDNYPIYIENNLDTEKTIKNIKKEFINDSIYINLGTFITEDFLFNANGYFLTNKAEIPERIKKCFVKINNKDKYFEYVSCGQHGFKTTKMKIKDLATEDNFLDNYNNDFPWDKLSKFVRSDTSGLALMFGIPGTGNIIAVQLSN